MENKSLKILMLEDVAADAELIEHQLKKGDFAFTTERVSSKAAFLKALAEVKPDVILSDYSLPNFSGLDAFLLAHEKTNGTVPFILVTGALPEATIIDIVKAGIDDYMLKDNLQRLPGAVKNAYAKKDTERRNRHLNELREKFIEIMSHQLRTPLTAVSWNLEHLLSDEDGVKPAQQEIVRIAYEANQKLIKRIGDLLTVIDIEEGRAVLNKQKVSLESLWESVMVSWKKEAKVKGLTCDYHPPAKPLEAISADQERLRQVLEKLAENAIIYTPKGGKLTASITSSDGHVRFSLTDTGVGIPKSEQTDIFTTFFRASNAAVLMPDASGVGLAIAKYLVEHHDGTIGFTSKEGAGSTFWFELPTH